MMPAGSQCPMESMGNWPSPSARRHSLWDAVVGSKQSRQEECRQGWLEGQGGNWRVAEGRRGEERLEDREESGEGDEVWDDVGDDVLKGRAGQSLQAGNQVTAEVLGEAGAFTAPAAQPPPRGNSPHVERWAPQQGNHTSIVSYRSADKMEKEILSPSIPDVLLGQQEGVMLLVSPAHQRSELVAEGLWCLTTVGMSDGLQRHLCRSVAFSLWSGRGCGQSSVSQVCSA